MTSRQLGTCLLLSILLSIALPLAAQSGDEKLDLSIVIAPGGSYSELDGVDLELGFGLGLGWRFGERWGTELRALHNEGHFVDATSFQLGLRRILGGQRKWRPFVIFGAHLEDTEIDCDRIPASCLGSFDSSSELGAFAGGGFDWQFSKRSALRFDGRLAVYDSEQLGEGDNDLDLTVGYAFRF